MKLGTGALVFLLILIILAVRNQDGDWFSPTVVSKVETPNPDNLRFNLGNSDQVLIVTTQDWGSTHATAALWEKTSDGKTWKRVDGDYQARVGRSGLKVNRSEGDGTTPAGIFHLSSAFGASSNIETGLRYQKVEQGSCWISDVTDPKYNEWTLRGNCAPKNEDLFAGAQNNGPYAHAVVIDFNTHPVIVGKGSAIFLYRNEFVNGNRGPTRATKAGITLANDDLLNIFRTLSDDLQPVVVIGPIKWIIGPKESTSVVDGEKLDLAPQTG